jgi:DNA polymerase III subunit gamma/tau
MSDFIVSARKYRPTKFSDVIGQSHVSETLKNAMKSDHVGHAFLFCGPRGVGKTTNARILAKVLNCLNLTADFEPCNTCDSCQSFNENASFNIFELDAASNNSVENIRTLVDQVRFAPQVGKYKIYIIDEVHALSSSAFNAFLKTLEEPPAHAIFIMATTEKHKVLPTILSRCQIFDFKRIQVPDIVKQLQIICESEKIKAEPDALHIIAQKADGAMRDALSIFDRIISASTDNSISYNDVIENLNVLDYDYFFKVVDCCLAEDLPTLMNLFDNIVKLGFDPEIFISGLMEHLRNLLMCKTENTIRILELGENLLNRYIAQAKLAPNSFLITGMNLANECDIQSKHARNIRLHVEIYLIKILYLQRAFEITSNTQLEEKKNDNRLDSTENISEPAKTINEVAKVIVTKPEAKKPDVHLPTIDISEEESSDEDSIEEPIQDTILPDIDDIDDDIVAEPSSESEVEPSIIPKVRPIKNQPKLSANAIHSNVATELPKSFNINDIEALIEEENRILLETVSILSFETLTKSWEKYTEATESVIAKNILQATILELEDTIVVARIGNEMARSIIMDEKELMGFLRFDLSAPDLSLRIELDPTINPESDVQIKRVFTLKEKWEMMNEINPLVAELIQKLKLERDE